MSAPSAVRRRRAALGRWLPEGQSLPAEVWRARHNGIVLLLWLHAAAIPVYALVRGFSPLHALLETVVVPAAAVLAMWARLARRTRTAVASIGLLSCSAVLVHLSSGLIEMHFHFFVMVTVVALYQDWLPFFAAIGYVFVHHGLLGAVDAASVFNHEAGRNSPWQWAGIHAFFITGISLVCLVTWRLNERILAERRVAEERLREESRIVRSLHEVGQTLAADLDTQRVVQAVTDAATELTGAAYGAFFYNTLGSSGEALMLYTLSGAPIEAFSRFGLPRNTEVFGPTFRGEAVVRLDDVTKDPRYGKMAPHYGMPRGHLPVRSYLAVPVRSRSGEVLGGLFFAHPEPAQFSEVDESIVVGIAAQAAMAIDNAQLYESEHLARTASEAARANLAVLAGASKVVSSSLELDTVLRELAALVASGTGGYCALDLAEDDGSIRRLQASGDPDDPTRTSEAGRAPIDPAETGHPVVRAIRSGRSEFLDATAAQFIAGAAEGWSRPPSAAIVAPMIGRRNEIVGALSLVSVIGGARQLDQSDVSFVEELARRAASAVENARLYARQRTVAETLQHSLLPERLPQIPGVAAAARYLAGGPDVDIGGDWYDMLQLPDGRLALVLGDVVGRGERAAALMGQLRNAVRAHAVDGRTPRETMACLNALLLATGAEDMATMIYGVLDAETGEFRYVNAGHPPPLVLSPDATASFLEQAPGLPVGAVDNGRYGEVRVVLAPGETLLLYTDGLVEDRSEPLNVGLRRLRDTFVASSGNLEERCTHLLRERFAGRPPSDDVALLAVQLVPLGDRLHLRLPAHPSVLAPLRATLRRWLTNAGATEQESYEVLVATGEACTNAIRHAGAPAGSDFELEAVLADDLLISVRDHGSWRERRGGDGGYGLAIVEAYTDHVEVLRTASGTEVRMRRRLATMTPEAAQP